VVLAATNHMVQPARRSCLSVPGHAVRMHKKALSLPADEVVFDLEDAVAPKAKDVAREAVAATLAQPEWEGRTVAVRVNAPGSEDLSLDLAMILSIGGGVTPTVVVPKVQSPMELQSVAELIGPEIGLQALIESPVGIEAAAEIARAVPQLQTLILGYADLATALGRRGAERDVERWLYHQETVLGAARCAGLQAIDGPFFFLGDTWGLARATRAARELGFDGKWAIHPEQVEPLNNAFGATQREVRWATAVIEALAAADGGDGTARVEGAMVDEAMRAKAQRLLLLPRGRAASGRAALDGPAYYEDLAIGQTFAAPGVTLTDGLAALHQAIVGDRLRLSLDRALCSAVTGLPTPLAHPALVCDVSIGQSTEPSGRVIGNLFYRGLAARPVHLGTTLRSTTTVVAKQRTRSSGSPRGMVLLHITTTDADGQTVLDYHRCPLLPARTGDPEDASDDVQAGAAVVAEPDLHDLTPTHWRLDELRASALGPLFSELQLGMSWALEARETVSCAPELARLSLNLAMTHTDASVNAHGRRLVYGGHVVGIAAAHLTRALPDLATILAWHSCDHLGPAFEGDVLSSEIMVEALEPMGDGGIVHVRVLVSATHSDDEQPRLVLDWSLCALMP
jgi:citrate lyase beta subunit/acyl dehydratase